MKKKKNKKLILFIIFIGFVVSFCILYFLIINKNKNALSLEENKWIDSNKYNVIDVALANELPILNYDGNGIIYDFLNFVSEKHSLKFNIVNYKLDESSDYQYKLDIVNQINDSNLVLLSDKLVLITIDNSDYSELSDINDLKIGIIPSDKELIAERLNNIEYVEYSNYSELRQAMINAKVEVESDVTPSINGIIIPKTLFTKEIIVDNYKISYHFNDLDKYFILSTSGDKELTSILKKDFNVWKEKNYNDSYNDNLLDLYYKFRNISDLEKKKLQSKKYVYGFIDYGIYNSLEGNKISGFNKLVLKDFNNFSKLSIKYTKYNSIIKMLEDFNSGKLDFVMNISDREKYNSNLYDSVGAFNKKLVIISGKSNKDTIDSIYSLKGRKVLTIKDSYLEKYLSVNGAKTVSYNNLKDLVADFKDDDILLIDLENYNYYKTSTFKDSKINYILDLSENYNYIINNSDENDQFKNIFDFYLNYNSIERLIYQKYDDVAYSNINYIYILLIIIIALVIYVVVDFSNHVKYLFKKIKINKKTKLSKEDKIKYIDQLTSLKNRAYLNSKIESWDESGIYPQAVIVIDLNNISYINDNYGREEGDKVITEAANIFIQNQLQNSEIIRTDGNEFLIYLVGYNEKQVISYLRKLNKELKNLSHGFGAASGYSIIPDAIKTFDDAVNEATLDMKNNKEDIDY